MLSPHSRMVTAATKYIFFHRRRHGTPSCDGSAYMAPYTDAYNWVCHYSPNIRVCDNAGTVACFAYEQHRLPHDVALLAAAVGLH